MSRSTGLDLFPCETPFESAGEVIGRAGIVSLRSRAGAGGGGGGFLLGTTTMRLVRVQARQTLCVLASTEICQARY